MQTLARIDQSAPPHCIETHISWVILTPSFAYKIKKPVNFGFLDFSTLAKRKHACDEELRLNRRFSTDLYLSVDPITGTPSHPVLSGGGTPIEYAVKMRRFDSGQQFDQLLASGQLAAQHIEALATRIATIHLSLPAEPAEQALHRISLAHHYAEENFAVALPLIHNSETLGLMQQLQTWTQREAEHKQAIFNERALRGFIRECHGDLHLGNIALENGKPLIFDCIEFNPDLRWIDVFSEVAFTLMDLESHGAIPLANRFLNRYLELTGDYQGVAVLDFYRLYRAMVRVKVSLLQLQQSTCVTERNQRLSDFQRYLDYAHGLLQKKTVTLVILHGFSGSGKSRLAVALCAALPAIHLRSDVERKRTPPSLTSPPAQNDLYSDASRGETYQHLSELAKSLLNEGCNVVLDATHLQQSHRELALRTAAASGAAAVILDCQAPVAQLKQRISRRRHQGHDPSDADVQVLETQLRSAEPLGAHERRHTVTLDMTAEIDISGLISTIERVRRPPGD